MNNTPVVSAIIPCYNQGNFLLEAVGSVLNQSYKNIEIIIINDGSDDGETLEILDSFDNPQIKVLHQENAGPGMARNLGVKMAKADFIVFLDSDDLICDGSITAAIKVLQEHPSTAVVYGNCRYFGKKDYLLIPKPVHARTLLKGDTIAVCSIIRKTAFEDAGGFDELLSKKGLEDWDFWMALIEKGWKFHYLNQTNFKIRVLNSSRTFQVANKNLEELKSYIYKKHSDMLAREFHALYHENKNLKNTIDYKSGRMILSPLRWLKNLFAKNRNC